MGQMRKVKRLVTLGIAGIVLTSSLVAAPAFADSGAGATPAPLTSAVIAMIVGIIVANGVCKNNRQMRIYPLAGPAGFSCQ